MKFLKLSGCALGACGLVISNQFALGAPDVVGDRGNIGTSHTLGGSWSTITGGGNNIATNNYAVVSGGQSNRTSIYGVVGGGVLNLALDYGVVAGGILNSNTSLAASIGGGVYNQASSWAAVSGGYSNVAGYLSTIGGGQQNNSYWAEGDTIGGGRFNYSEGIDSVTGGGNGNYNAGYSAVIGGGSKNTNATYGGTIGGGEVNTAQGDYSTVPGGVGARARLHAQQAYAGGYFQHIGDAQGSLFVLRRETTSTNTAELFLDGSSQRMTLAGGLTWWGAWAFDVLIIASDSTGDIAGYKFSGIINNATTTTAWVTKTVLHETVGSWDANVLADDTNDALVIYVNGDPSARVRWVATVRTSETLGPP